MAIQVRHLMTEDAGAVPRDWMCGWAFLFRCLYINLPLYMDMIIPLLFNAKGREEGGGVFGPVNRVPEGVEMIKARKKKIR